MSENPETGRRARARQLALLRARAANCQNCDLYRRATQTVFGAGPSDARLVLVGEQPGDAEDRAGEPFVGPAGRLLREALVEAGLDPDEIYLTNAVKHFKWTERGKRRLHERPRLEEVMACRMWLDDELTTLEPAMVVALGATAALALFGSAVQVLRDRGKVFPSIYAPRATLTVHPSSILRAPDAAARAKARTAFVRDLTRIAAALRTPPPPGAAPAAKTRRKS